MADREILRVEIDDSEFSEFKRKWDEYEAAVKAMPAQWKAASTEITVQKTNFEKLVDSAGKLYHSMEQATIAQSASSRFLEGAGVAWLGIHRTGKLFHKQIHDATASLRHWTKLTAVFSGILGAGGLFGINRMAESVARQRTSASGLGVTYGEQASFLTNFGRLGNAEGILQGFSEAETDVSKRYALRQYLGHMESGDPARDFAEGLGRFKEFVDKTPQELLESSLHARGYDRLGLGTEQARIIRGMSAAEIAQIGRGYSGDVAGRLGLSDADAKKWTEFTNQMERAGREIETVFAKRTVKLTKPLENLSNSFVNLTAGLLKDGSPIHGWIKDLGKGIGHFAEELGSGAVQAKASKIGKDIADTIKLFDAIVEKAPGGLAVLLGMAAGARVGGAAVAAGTALARSRVLGVLGEGAAVVLGPAGALAAGGLAASSGRPNESVPEIERQRRFHQGRFPASVVNSARRKAFGHTHFDRGHQAQHIGGSPQEGAAAAGTPWNREVPAPLGPGMGRNSFMHGQFGAPGQNLTRITTSGGHTVTVNKAAAPHFKGFLEDLEAAGAPIHQNLLGGYNNRNIAGRRTKSQHAYGNAVDIDSTGRNIITKDFAAWARSHDKELRASERHWGIRAGRDWSNPDMGHWEWGGGAGDSQRRASFGHPHAVGHHPATIGQKPQSMIIEDHTGGMVHVSAMRATNATVYALPGDRWLNDDFDEFIGRNHPPRGVQALGQTYRMPKGAGRLDESTQRSVPPFQSPYIPDDLEIRQPPTTDDERNRHDLYGGKRHEGPSFDETPRSYPI